MALLHKLRINCILKDIRVLNQIRLCSTVSEKKGLVLGVFSEKSTNRLVLTPAAKTYDDLTCGKLTEALKYASNGEVKHQKPYVLWNLCENYHSVTVVGIGEPAIAYDDLEELDERKEAIRNAAHVGLQAFKSLGIYNVEFDDMDCPEATAEGAILSSYHFDMFRKEKGPKLSILPFQNQSSTEWKNGIIKAKAQNVARRMMDIPSSFKSPKKFADIVKTELEGTNVHLEIRDEQWIEEKKMGGLLSVSSGSDESAVFLEMSYKGASSNVDPIVLVGKGVTFDAGGYALKPSKDMDKMRADCGGACCVVATMKAISELELPINVIGLVPLTENLINGKATKPGDVITMMNGKTVAVDNPDAEGRLILGDALCYSAHFNPKFVLDIATLTGAIVVSLGTNCTGVFTNSYPYWQSLRQAGAQSGDRMWRMPLWKCYTKNVTNYSAYDLNNIGKGQGGGSCTAAAFLKEFVPSGVEWAHLDIAGVAMGPTDDKVIGKGMTGKPTRTLIYFLELSSRFDPKKNK